MRKLIVVLFPVILLLLNACSRKAILQKYYLVEFPYVEDTTEAQPPLVDAYCEVLPLRVSPAFSRPNIAFRQGSNEITYFVYHQWANPPEEAFTHLMESYLNRKGLFTLVSSELWKVVPDYEIRGEIHQLEVAYLKNRFAAHLHMSLMLIDKQDDRATVVHTFDQYRPLPRKDLNLFAAAVSQIFKTELDRFGEKMRTYLSRKQVAAQKTNGQ